MRTASEAVPVESLTQTPCEQAVLAFENARSERGKHDSMLGPVLHHYIGGVVCDPECSHPHSPTGDSGIDQTPENIGY